MTSLRYIFLAFIYVYLMYLHYITDDHYYQSNIIIFIVTTIFMYIVKYLDNQKCDQNKKLKLKYIFNWSIFYGIISVIANYIYDFFIQKECVTKVMLVDHILILKYTLEAFFIAGFVLLFNQISNLLYYNCE